MVKDGHAAARHAIAEQFLIFPELRQYRPESFLGRLDVTSGKVTEWQSPSGPKSEPYGMVAVNGIIWYNESGAKPNTIVRFDPKTEKFQSWAIPGGGDIVRNMSVTPDGNPVTANSLVNQVGLVEVK